MPTKAGTAMAAAPTEKMHSKIAVVEYAEHNLKMEAPLMHAIMYTAKMTPAGSEAWLLFGDSAGVQPNTKMNMELSNNDTKAQHSNTFALSRDSTSVGPPPPGERPGEPPEASGCAP
mmetsp:Transcript_66474/g.203434  ORF Transcript_66474/g.203434 Transcript_66474/m.203434 type:complete len:117 (-) Transcript_66474:481-831(-)